MSAAGTVIARCRGGRQGMSRLRSVTALSVSFFASAAVAAAGGLASMPSVHTDQSRYFFFLQSCLCEFAAHMWKNTQPK